MTDKALIRARRGAPAAMETAAAATGVTVQHERSDGILVSGDTRVLEQLASGPERVKLLRDTNLLRLYDHVIDIEAPDLLDGVSTRRRVPSAAADGWMHHLAQLDGPPTEDWIGAIVDTGVDVVEPLGAYGLFICGSPEDAARVAELDFVAWVGPMQPEWRLGPGVVELRGDAPFAVGVCPPSETAAVAEEIRRLGGEVRSMEAPDPGSARAGTLTRYGVVRATMSSAAARNDLAREVYVRYIEHDPPPDLADERSVQVLTESTAGAAGPTTTGYPGRLAEFGVDGDGVTIAIVDSGIDTHDDTTMHPDLRGRFSFFSDMSGGAFPGDRSGHGTHVAGIAAGDGDSGDEDPDGFVLGQGVAPGASVGSINGIGTGASTAISTWFQNAVQNDAAVANNSWGWGGNSGVGYTGNCATVDAAVRDPDSGTAVFERMSIVFAAGNNGGFVTTVNEPNEAKNSIVVGNSLTSRPGEAFLDDDIRGMSGRSSRGPCVDGRIVPTVVAPGTDIVSARTTIDGDPTTPGVQVSYAPYVDTDGTDHDEHHQTSGTSMAAPHVSGAVALLVQRWRERTGQDPSPALVRALLINTAEDIAGGPNWRAMFRVWGTSGSNFTITGLGFTPAAVAERVFSTGTWSTMNQVATAAAVTNPGDWSYAAGTDRLTVNTTNGNRPYSGAAGVGIWCLDPDPIANIPNGDQGWGRVSLENLLLSSPESDRGPRIVVDERLGFDTDLQEWNIRVAPVDPSRPLRITLAWTDAPGANGSNPAIVNDLDLEVTEVDSGDVYRGNVFDNGFSVPGGAFDNVNTVECVYVQNPTGVYDVAVIASNLRADARPPFSTTSPWQDFAIVLDNAEVQSDRPIDVSLAIDRSGSMVTNGYVETTRTAARGLVDLLQIDDSVGVTSFATSASDDFPSTTPPSIRQIDAAQDRDDAKAAVSGLSFGGSTAMGEGLQTAADQLTGATGAKNIVLFSDGYDNGAPDARTVAGGLAADIDVHTLAMGTLSDEVLLEDIANATGGRYLFMPTIDDLFLLVNVLREEITGDGLVVNTRHTASASRVAAYVEQEASAATFLVSFDDPAMTWTADAPEGRAVAIRLRAPNGKLLHPHEPTVRRVEGPGYVAFRVDEPLAGQWYVEVNTERRVHTDYTVGVFVISPIALDVAIPETPLRGGPFEVAVRVDHPEGPVRDLSGRLCVSFPTSTVDDQLRRFRRRLRDLRLVRSSRSDLIPSRFRSAFTLQQWLRRTEQRELVEHATRCIDLRRPKTIPDRDDGLGIGRGGIIGGGGVIGGRVVGGGGRVIGGGGRVVGGRAVGLLSDATPAAELPVRDWDYLRRLIGGRGFIDLIGRRRDPDLVGSWPATPHAGSYNATVVVQGTSASGSRFVRTTTRSIRVR